MVIFMEIALMASNLAWQRKLSLLVMKSNFKPHSHLSFNDSGDSRCTFISQGCDSYVLRFVLNSVALDALVAFVSVCANIK